MREIKFRAWDGKELILWKELLEDYYGLEELGNSWKWMQYTGLKDKNGKEIYEGDIVKHPIYPRNLQVIWLDGKYVSKFEASKDGKHGFETIALTICEVIGNIYENPELVKESK